MMNTLRTMVLVCECCAGVFPAGHAFTRHVNKNGLIHSLCPLDSLNKQQLYIIELHDVAKPIFHSILTRHVSELPSSTIYCFVILEVESISRRTTYEISGRKGYVREDIWRRNCRCRRVLEDSNACSRISSSDNGIPCSIQYSFLEYIYIYTKLLGCQSMHMLRRQSCNWTDAISTTVDLRGSMVCTTFDLRHSDIDISTLVYRDLANMIPNNSDSINISRHIKYIQR